MSKKRDAGDVRLGACYIRVSTDDQAEYSPDSQLKEMRSYAAANNIVLLEDHIYVDEGISGKRSENRPAFQRMIAFAKNKPCPFDTLLLYKFSRFARNREDSVLYKSLLRKKCGVDVISIKEPLDADNKMSLIMEAIIEAMDEYYSINLSEDVRRTQKEKHSRGELQAGPPFGFRVENNTYIPVPEQIPIVQECFRRFISGHAYFAIAKWLNNSGVTTRHGNPWENRGVEYMLRNPAYIGKLRRSDEGRIRRDFDAPTVRIVEGKHEAVIDMETWEAAQKRVAEIKAQTPYKARPAITQKSWLSGLARCAACGKTLVFAKPHYWKCNGYAHGSCRHSQHVRDDLLKGAIFSRLERDINSACPIQTELIRTTGPERSEIADLEAQAERLRKKILRLREAFLGGVESLEVYQEYKAAIEAEIAEAEEKIAKGKAASIPDDPDKMIRQAIKATMDLLKSEKVSELDKHRAAHDLIEKAVWDKEKNQLKLYYRLFF